MPLIKYTTEIPVTRTVQEIIDLLTASGAKRITQDFDGKHCIGIEFLISTRHGELAFKLPAFYGPALTVLKRDALAGKIPKKFANDIDQARRCAWRIVLQWVEAQLAMISLGMVKAEQVFLPYAISPDSGKTLFATLEDNGFQRLALPAPAKEGQ